MTLALIVGGVVLGAVILGTILFVASMYAIGRGLNW